MTTRRTDGTQLPVPLVQLDAGSPLPFAGCGMSVRFDRSVRLDTQVKPIACPVCESPLEIGDVAPLPSRPGLRAWLARSYSYPEAWGGAFTGEFVEWAWHARQGVDQDEPPAAFQSGDLPHCPRWRSELSADQAMSGDFGAGIAVRTGFDPVAVTLTMTAHRSRLELSGAALCSLNDASRRAGLNRVLATHAAATLRPQQMYRGRLVMVHQHARGRRVLPHARIEWQLGESSVYLDAPAHALLDALDDIEIPAPAAP